MNKSEKISADSVKNFSETDKNDFPLLQTDQKYPPELAVFQNLFWQLKHEIAPSDDVLKILFLFSPKIRLSDNELSEKIEFTITAKEYSEITGIKLESAYSTLKKVVDSLYQHSVIFYHTEKKRPIRTRLISTCSYSSGCFYVSFTHFALYIMSVFNKENPFTKFTLKSAVSMSGHGLKLYPFLVQNLFRQEFEVPIDHLKKALGLRENTYPEYRDFKKSILKPHIDLINEKTELSVQFKAIKKSGRKASHVGFTVNTSKKQLSSKAPQQQSSETPVDSTITAKMVYSKIIMTPELLERFRHSTETMEELRERIKADFKAENGQYWIDKLAELNIVL